MHVPALRVALSATGAERWYRVSCAPVRDAAGRVSGVAVSVGDVTETDGDTITADLVTENGSLALRLEVDPHTGVVKGIE